MDETVSVDRLRELLDYDPDAGQFTWLRSKGRAVAGRRAGTQRPDGRRDVSIDGHKYLEHRLAWLWMTGEWPTNIIDHINGDPSDNRWGNLRDVTYAENGQNRRYIRGVSWNKAAQRWYAYVRLDRRLIYLGYYVTIDEALAARRAGELRYFTHSPTQLLLRGQ